MSYNGTKVTKLRNEKKNGVRHSRAQTRREKNTSDSMTFTQQCYS